MVKLEGQLGPEKKFLERQNLFRLTVPLADLVHLPTAHGVSRFVVNSTLQKGTLFESKSI